ncbi:MAG: hypothetical protein WC553_01815 [Patescibacteria group bacterium]
MFDPASLFACPFFFFVIPAPTSRDKLRRESRQKQKMFLFIFLFQYSRRTEGGGYFSRKVTQKFPPVAFALNLTKSSPSAYHRTPPYGRQTAGTLIGGILLIQDAQAPMADGNTKRNPRTDEYAGA